MLKAKIVRAVIEHLESELAATVKAAKAAHEAATHEESRAEDQHDTRGIEASYLAGAQAQRATELEAQLAGLRQLNPKDAPPDSAASSGSLLELETSGRTSWALLVSRAGGVQVTVDGSVVRVISPQSPLGEELLGRHAGDEVEIDAQGATRAYRIKQVK